MSYRQPLGQTSTPSVPMGQLRAGTPTSQADCQGGFIFRPAGGRQSAMCDVCPVSGATLPCGPGTISNPVRDACGYANPPCIIDTRARMVDGSGRPVPVAVAPQMYTPPVSETVRRFAPFLAIGAAAGAIAGGIGGAQGSQGRALAAGGVAGAVMTGIGLWMVSGMAMRG